MSSPYGAKVSVVCPDSSDALLKVIGTLDGLVVEGKVRRAAYHNVHAITFRALIVHYCTSFCASSVANCLPTRTRNRSSW